MTTFPTLSSTIDVSGSDPISPETQSYIAGRHRSAVYDAALEEFFAAQDERGLQKKDIARRLGVDPAQVTRWLSGPGNWTLDTVALLLLAMGADHEPKIARLSDRALSNRIHPLVAAPKPLRVVDGAKAAKPRRASRSSAARVR